MAKLRRFSAYRRLERPYTRISKYKAQSYVKTNPHKHVVSYNMGTQKKKFSHTMLLLSKVNIQIRDNSIESARLTCSKLLETSIGLTSYFLQIRKYPHHILREHAMATGAGADRFSSGMARSFGVPIGSAARVARGDLIFQLSLDEQNLDLGKKALKRAISKLPCRCLIEVVQNDKLE